MIICGTGHRPPKLGGYTVDVFSRLIALGCNYIMDKEPDKIISGMALGWDMALARACVELNIYWTAAIPFDGVQARWPHQTIKAWSDLLDQADNVHYVSDGGYAPWKMHKRNEWMVDHSDKVVALYNGDPLGGTAACLHYAESKDKTVDNLWKEWMEMNPQATSPYLNKPLRTEKEVKDVQDRD